MPFDAHHVASMANRPISSHTGGVITLSLDTLVSLGSLVAVGLALYAALRGFRTELKGDIAELRTDLKTVYYVEEESGQTWEQVWQRWPRSEC